MSRTSIELNQIAVPQVPQAVFAKTPSTRRPSTVISNARSDEVTLRGLERTTTTTSKATTAIVIASVTLITGISTLLSGLTTVTLPTMAVDLEIPDNLLLWPSSIQALTCGCALLLSGSIADALGSRFMYMVGSILQSFFTLGCGLARNANEIIIFRALSGVAIAFCLPSAVSIITSTLDGKRRNFAFASMGGGQPVGFSIGLTLGGVLTDSIGWRWGFYLAAILNTIVVAVALWGLPSSIDNAGLSEDEGPPTWKQRWHRMKTEIDWIGAIIASTSLAMLSYVFATIAGSRSSIKQPSSIVLLTSAVLLIPAFIYWVGRQERLGRPAIIPNSLWRNRIFTTICAAVFFTWGSFNALETIMTFYFQDVQKYSATQTSIYFLPAPIAGVICNLAMGFLVHRVPANWLAIVGSLVSLGAPLAMVTATPKSIYWSTAFLANIFNPTGADSLFTISNLLITSVFHAKTQALAGGVFNTVSQIGKSVGLGLVAVIAADITAKSPYEDKKSPEALLEGYKATWWFCFACIVFTVALSVWGLRGIGRVGHKRD